MRFVEQVVEEQNTAAIRDLCRALQQHRLLESPHLHVRSLALEVKIIRRTCWRFWVLGCSLSALLDITTSC